MKILYGLNQITPYHLARLKSLKNKLNDNFNLEVLEIFNSSNKYKFDKNKESFSNHKLNATPIGNQDSFGIKNIFQLIIILHKVNPKIMIISGWGGIYNITQIFWGKLFRKKIIILSDSQLIDFKRYKIKEFFKKLVIKDINYFFVAGSSHSSYLENLGICKSKIYKGVDAIDNDHFFRDRKNHKWSNNIVTIARLSKEKNLERAIKSFEIFSKKYSKESWQWNIIGYGDLDIFLKEIIDKKKLNVKLLGFKNYEEIPEILFRNSIYWQPSIIEQWGLSINEAAANGLPLLISRNCGAANELCDNKNGWVFNPFSVKDMVEKLEEVRNDKFKWGKLGLNSQEKVKSFSLENYTKTFKIILDKASK